MIAVPIAALILLVFYPLAAIILQSVFPNLYAAKPNLIPQFDTINQVLTHPITLKAITNTLWISGITAVLTCVFGTLLAILTERTDMPGRRIFRLMVWLVFLHIRICLARPGHLS